MTFSLVKLLDNKATDRKGDLKAGSISVQRDFPIRQKEWGIIMRIESTDLLAPAVSTVELSIDEARQLASALMQESKAMIERNFG